jgi:diguanylate cyclase (GGDEF)-like protein/PAS domain S-box-containing protein
MTAACGLPAVSPRSLRILLVEDDLVDEMSFRRLVAREGLPYQVVTATSVVQARHRLADEIFDVVITDYSLGDGTALDLAGKAPRVPWIIVTGAGDEAVAVAALRAGAQDYIVKKGDGSHLKLLPFSIDAAVKLARAQTVVRMLSHAMKSVRDAVYITDLQGNFLFVNAAFERFYGDDPVSLAGSRVPVLGGHGSSAPGTRDVDAGWVGEVVHRRKDGTDVPVWLSISQVEDEDGNVAARVHVARDMTERRQLEDTLRYANQELVRANEELERSHRALEELAVRDDLTGLFNRRELNRMLEDEVARSARSNRSLSLILLDLDHFKNVNDEYGHLAGDEVLRGLGKVLGRTLRCIDRAARFGGEELAILLPDTPDYEAIKVAERIRQLIAITPHSVVAGGGAPVQIFVTASLGLASLDDTHQTPEDLLRRADEALYRAKAEGRNRALSLDLSVPPRSSSTAESFRRS